MLSTDPAESALLREVCGDPPNDEPRLAYADWVERHAGSEGSAYAEYIRRSIKVYREDNQLGDNITVDLLTDVRKSTWSNGVSGLGLNIVNFVRGFIASAVADASTLLRVGSDLIARCPLQYVTVFGGAKSHLSELLIAPWMQQVFALDLARNDLTDDDVRTLAQCELKHLRWLGLGGNNLTIQAAEVMAAATVAGRFPLLHTLQLPLDIYDDVEGGYGMTPIQMTVFRPDDGTRLRAQYGELPWLTPRPRGLRGQLYS